MKKVTTRVLAASTLGTIAVAAAAVPAVAAKAPKPKNVLTERVLRSETVDGVKYEAVGAHSFKVRFKNPSKKNPFRPVYDGKYDDALVVSATPEADSKLTLVSTSTSRPVIERSNSGKKAFLSVSTKFSGVVKTIWGNSYEQSGTLTTKLVYDGSPDGKKVVSVKLDPVTKL